MSRRRELPSRQCWRLPCRPSVTKNEGGVALLLRSRSKSTISHSSLCDAGRVKGDCRPDERLLELRPVNIFAHRVALSPCPSPDYPENLRKSTSSSITSREAFSHGLMCGVLLRRISGRFMLLYNVYFAMLAIGCCRREDARALHERSVRHGAGRPSRGIEPTPHPSRPGYTNDGSTTYRYMKLSVAMLLSKLVLR